MTEDTSSAYGPPPDGEDPWKPLGVHWSKIVDGQGRVTLEGTPDQIEQAVDQLHRAYRRAYLEWLKAMPYHDYLKTDHWQSVRERKFNEVGDRCQVCNSEGPCDVHHRTYESRGNELMLDLTVLCRDCHTLYHEQGRIT